MAEARVDRRLAAILAPDVAGYSRLTGAVDVQCGMVQRNSDVPQEKRIEFRIGINVGDIISGRNYHRAIAFPKPVRDRA
jgi:class 3 adenylate cyclase